MIRMVIVYRAYGRLHHSQQIHSQTRQILLNIKNEIIISRRHQTKCYRLSFLLVEVVL